MTTNGNAAPSGRERQLAALRPPWKPGESGNPSGRPKNTPLITPRLRQMANMTIGDFFALPLQKMTLADIIAAGYMLEAMQSGGERARAEVTDRLDGGISRGDMNVEKAVILIRQYTGVDPELLG